MKLFIMFLGLLLAAVVFFIPLWFTFTVSFWALFGFLVSWIPASIIAGVTRLITDKMF